MKTCLIRVMMRAAMVKFVNSFIINYYYKLIIINSIILN